MRLRDLPSDYLQPDVLTYLLKSGGLNLLALIRCATCKGNGTVDGLDCATCEGDGCVPHSLPPLQLIRAVERLVPASARKAREAAIAEADLRALNQSTPGDPTPPEWKDLLISQYLESRFKHCFRCGLELVTDSDDRERKWCAHCQRRMSYELFLYLREARKNA